MTVLSFFQEHPRNKEILDYVKKPISAEPEDIYKLHTPLECELPQTCIELPSGRKTVHLRQARLEDVLTVEGLIRKAAREGTGFGLDEFTSQGLFNRKFLRETSLLIASWEDGGQPIGAVLLGPSAVCRSTNLLMNFYLLVDCEQRRHGIGTGLFHQMELLANRLEYEGILLDVYQSDGKALEWLQKQGYHVTASLPDCGYIKGQGYVNCLLLYKDFHFKSKY